MRQGGGVRPSREGGGWRGRAASFVPGLGRKPPGHHGAPGRAAVPGATPPSPSSPETSTERRLPRPRGPPRLRPSPRALPALVPKARGRRRRADRRSRVPHLLRRGLLLSRPGPGKRFKSTAVRKGAKPPLTASLPHSPGQAWREGVAPEVRQGWVPATPGVPGLTSASSP